MAISNPNPQPLDIVIFQRDDTNTYWGETHISGANLIFYVDSNGHINADYSASFYALFPPSGSSSGGGSGTTLITGALYYITSSWAISASWAPSTGGSGTTLVTGGLYPITASWAETASWALNAINGGTNLITGGLYPITASWAQSASWAVNAVNALTSLIAISASWSSQSLSSSYINVLVTASNVNFFIPFVTTSSYQPVYIDPNSIYYNPGTDTLIVNNISASTVTASLQGTSSWAQNSVSSSYADTASFNLSSSHALSSDTSISASHANSSDSSITASFALNFNPSATASFATNAATASLAQTASSINFLMTNDTSSFYIPFIASGSRGTFTGSGQVMYVDTSSILYNPGTNLLTVNFISASSVTASLLGTSSFSTTASFSNNAGNAISSSYALTSSFLQGSILYVSSSIQNNNYTFWTAIAGSPQAFTLSTSSNLVDSGSFAILTGTSSVAVTSVTASFATTVPANIYFNSVTSSAYAISQSIFSNQTNSYTISNGDDGRLVVVNSGSLFTITVTTSSISTAFSSMYYQSGSGRIAFVTASTSVFLRNRSGFTGSAGQYALVSLLRVPNGDFVLGGDLS